MVSLCRCILSKVNQFHSQHVADNKHIHISLINHEKPMVMIDLKSAVRIPKKKVEQIDAYKLINADEYIK